VCPVGSVPVLAHTVHPCEWVFNHDYRKTIRHNKTFTFVHFWGVGVAGSEGVMLTPWDLKMVIVRREITVHF
jgi:hypothetical protein